MTSRAAPLKVSIPAHGALLLLAAGPFLAQPGANNIYGPVKIAFFILGSLALLCVSALLRGDELFDGAPGAPRAAAAAAAALIAIAAASSALSDSMLSTLPGMCRLAAFGALFLTARACLGDPRLLRRTLAASFAASVAVSLIGILMYFLVIEYRYIEWGERIASLFDDPNNLGGYLVWNIAAGLALFAGTRSRAARAAIGAGMAAALLCLLMSSSRSAWAAGAVTLPAMLVLMRRRFAPAFRSLLPLFAILLALGCAFVVFTAVNKSQTMRGLNVVHRVKSYGAFLGTEGQERVLMHRGAARVAADHPLLGVGPDNLRRHLPGAIARSLSPEDPEPHKIIYVPHAYNDYLTMAAETGAPGALAFAAVFVCGLILAWNRVRAAGDAEQGLLLLACGAVVLECMLRAGLYQSIILNPLEWFPLAVALGALCAAPGVDAAPGEQDAPPPLWTRAALFAACALVLAASARVILPPLAAGVPFNTSLHALEGGDAARGLRAARQAYALAPLNEELAAHLGYAHFRNRDFEQAVHFYSRALELQPQYTPAMQYLGNAYLAMGDCGAAIRAYRNLREFVPNSVPAMEREAWCLMRSNRCGMAMPLYDRLMRLEPDTARHPFYAGVCALRQGHDIRRALGLLHAARRLDPDDPAILYNLGNATLKFGRPGEASRWLRQALEQDPGFYQAHATLAHIANALGDQPGAKQHLLDFLSKKGAPAAAVQTLQSLEVTPDNFQEIYEWAMTQ